MGGRVTLLFVDHVAEGGAVRGDVDRRVRLSGVGAPCPAAVYARVIQVAAVADHDGTPL